MQWEHNFNVISYIVYFHPLEAVSRWRDPQLQVSENYSHYFTFFSLWVYTLTHELLYNTERHNNEGDKQVGDGQGHQEVVGDVVKFLLHEHRQADQSVAHDTGHDDHAQEENVPAVRCIGSGTASQGRVQPRRVVGKASAAEIVGDAWGVLARVSIGGEKNQLIRIHRHRYPDMVDRINASNGQPRLQQRWRDSGTVRSTAGNEVRRYLDAAPAECWGGTQAIRARESWHRAGQCYWFLTGADPPVYTWLRVDILDI